MCKDKHFIWLIILVSGQSEEHSLKAESALQHCGKMKGRWACTNTKTKGRCGLHNCTAHSCVNQPLPMVACYDLVISLKDLTTSVPSHWEIKP